MLEENEAIADAIRAIVHESCKELFDAYGVDLVTCSDGTRTVNEIVWCGVMGFAGSDLRGSVLLAGTQGPLSRSLPAQGELRDWVGELTNQLVGRLKVQLLERGTAIALSTPVVLQGEHVAPLPRRVVIPIAFEAEEGTILVWVDVESRPGFALPANPNSALLATGEDCALFF